MAKMTTKFTFEIEPIVKLDCIAIDCKNNLYLKGFFCCNLKFINHDEKGQCEQLELIDKAQGDAK